MRQFHHMVIALICAVSLQSINAYVSGPVSLPITASTSSTTRLDAASRRGVLGKLRGAFVGIATMTAFRQPEVASAEETPSAINGRIVELQVANLNGMEGQTGTIKIQMRPEWAPRGVKRFEVCHYLCLLALSSTIRFPYSVLMLVVLASRFIRSGAGRRKVLR